MLFITGYAENAVLGSGHLELGLQVMTKPFVLEALASRAKELIENLNPVGRHRGRQHV